MDFNNETTITRPRTELLHFMILEARYNLIMHFRKHQVVSSKFQKDNLPEIKASLIEVYNFLFVSMAHSETEFLKKINEIEESKDVNDLRKIFMEFEKFMYMKKVTKFDNWVIYDSTNPESVNKANGID